MKTPVLILYLEDNPRDAELVCDKLMTSMSCETVVAINRAEYEAALARRHFDLILSDYSLPDYDGMRALALAREKQPDTPFILVTGTLGEEKAVESVVRGATDYVLKQRLERLMPAITLALAENEEKKRLRHAESALRKSEEKYRQLVQNTHDIIYSMTANGVFTFVSHAWTLLLGHPEDQVVGQSFQKFVHPDDVPRCMAWLEELVKSRERRYGIEYRVRHADGTWRWHISKGVPVLDGAGVVTGCDGIASDISERKQLEERLLSSEANFQTFFDTVHDMIVVGSPEGKIVYSNPAVSKKLGYAPNELQEMNILDLHPPDKRREAEAIITAMFKGEEDYCPLPLQSKSGELVPVETRVWSGQWNGRACVFGVSRDITKEQEATRKFNQVFSCNPAPMAVSDLPERRFTEVNDAFLNVLGYSRAEVIGKTTEELGLFVLKPDQSVVNELKLHGRIVNCELKVRRKDGAIIEGLFFGEVISSQGRQHLLTVMLDQTKRKHAEVRIEHLEKLLRNVADVMPDMVWAKDLDRKFVFVNKAVCDGLLCAKDIEEPIGRTDMFFVERERKSRPDDPVWHTFGEICLDSDAAVLESGKTGHFDEFGNVRGKFLALEVIKTPLRDESGKIIGTVGAGRDITKRRHAEEEAAKQLTELKRWQSVTIGREGRIAELKREVNALHKRLGEKSRYDSVE